MLGSHSQGIRSSDTWAIANAKLKRYRWLCMIQPCEHIADFDINSFLEDGTGLTQFLYLFHKIQISTWKPSPWRYPYVVLARIS